MPMHQQYWPMYSGLMTKVPKAQKPLMLHWNHICQTNHALLHPSAASLLQYATCGCPVQMQKLWTVQQMQSAIDWGPQKWAQEPEAITKLHQEVAEKVWCRQPCIVDWLDIFNGLPPQLQISPISMILQKSWIYCTILDLSFSIQLQDGTQVPLVNEATVKLAPKADMNQLWHSLSQITHAFASTSRDEKVFMAKWDIKDGFWCLDCEEDEDWNFAFIFPATNRPSKQLTSWNPYKWDGLRCHHISVLPWKQHVM